MFEKQRKITVLALILGLPMLLSGQERPARFYYGIGGGISNPVLGYQDYHSPALGLAQPGFMASWNLGYQMPSGIGFGLNSCYLLNKINSTTMAEKIREENKTTSSVEVSASNYQHWGVTANVSYSHKLTKKWSLMASSGLGILWSTTPEITLDIENAPPQHIEINQPLLCRTLAFRAFCGICNWHHAAYRSLCQLYSKQTKLYFHA